MKTKKIINLFGGPGVGKSTTAQLIQIGSSLTFNLTFDLKFVIIKNEGGKMIKLNKQVVDFGQFPNGELYLDFTKLKTNSYNRIIWQYESNSDFLKLGLLKDYLDSIFSNTDLHILYLPYSRMDRVNDTYSFSLKYVTKLINAMNFFAVKIREPHSDVTMALIERSVREDWCITQVPKLIEELVIKTIFFPDAGAQKRYAIDFPSAVGYKTRDFKTGSITDYTIQGEVGRSVLIIDDMCSRGGTFVHAVQELWKKGAIIVYLLVSYCEENVHTGPALSYLEKIYTSNEMVKKDQDIITLGDK